MISLTTEEWIEASGTCLCWAILLAVIVWEMQPLMREEFSTPVAQASRR